MTGKNTGIAVAKPGPEAAGVAPRRSARKRKNVFYQEPEEVEIDWVEPPAKKSKKGGTLAKKVKATTISSDSTAEDRDDEEDELFEFISAVSEEKPRKVANVTKKLKATVVLSDSASEDSNKEEEDEDEFDFEIPSVVTKKKVEKKKPAPRPAPKPKSRKKKTGGIQYDENGIELRQRDFEKRPSEKYLAAKHRAETHAIHFVDRARCDTEVSAEEQFTIAGTSGKDYDVHIKHIPKCNCMDSIMRGRQYHCKHIIYVYVNVLRVRDDLAYQMALTSAELNEIFNNAPVAPTERVDVKVGEDPNRKAIEGECPICYLDFEPEEEQITYCKNSCGNNVHTDCINVWIAKKQKEKTPPTCPYCRAHWVSG